MAFLQDPGEKGRGIASEPRPDTFYRDRKRFLPSLGEGG